MSDLRFDGQGFFKTLGFKTLGFHILRISHLMLSNASLSFQWKKNYMSVFRSCFDKTIFMQESVPYTMRLLSG